MKFIFQCFEENVEINITHHHRCTLVYLIGNNWTTIDTGMAREPSQDLTRASPHLVPKLLKYEPSTLWLDFDSVWDSTLYNLTWQGFSSRDPDSLKFAVSMSGCSTFKSYKYLSKTPKTIFGEKQEDESMTWAALQVDPFGLRSFAKLSSLARPRQGFQLRFNQKEEWQAMDNFRTGL